MKRNVLTWVLSTLLLGSGLASCSSDTIGGEEPKVVTKDTRVYIKVNLVSAGGSSTRAVGDNDDENNYIYGEEDEMKIHKISFVFYDALENYIAHQTWTPTSETQETQDGSLETLLSIVVPVELKEGQNMPKYVMAYVNPTNAAGTLNQKLSTILADTRTLDQLVPGTDKNQQRHDGFTMNNSVYYTGQNSEGPVIAAELPDGALFEDETTAKDAQGDDKVATIYVERVVAKVVVTKNDNDGAEINNLPQNNNQGVGTDNTTTYTLEFKPLAWGINNVEPETFLIKNFRNEILGAQNNSMPNKHLTGIENLTYGGAMGNTTLLSDLKNPDWNYYTPGTNDNELGGHRTFWAFSTSYFSEGGKYPATEDEYKKNKEDAYSLRYRSFNDICNATTEQKGIWGSALGEHQYTLEHTMFQNVITDNMQRAVSSVLVVGKYKIKKGDAYLNDNTSFYLQRATTSDTQNKIYVSDDELKKTLLAKNDVIYIKETVEGTETYVAITDKNCENYLNDFEIKHPESEIYGEIPTPSRYVTIQLKKPASNAIAGEATRSADTKYYYKDSNGLFNPISATNTDAANAALFTCMGHNGFNAVESFKSGMAYFNVPIKHLWYRDNKEMGEANFVAKLGQYGVVRNHIYRINIQGISGIGIGINDPTDPIIPGVESKKYYVKSQIRVLSWRLVPQQNVTLKP